MTASRRDRWLPKISIPGLCSQRSSAWRKSRSSLAWITSVPMACLRPKTIPARIDSTIAGVPPSSRATGSSR